MLAALCGIEQEIGGSLRPGIDHHVAHARLEWWREECRRCAAGSPAHPLTRELRAHLERTQPTAGVDSRVAGLGGLVDIATWDLASATFARREELTAYCRRWSAAMVTPLAADGGDRDGEAHGSEAGTGWSELGPALCELELLGRLAPDARSGRLRIPLDELEQAAVAPAAIAAPPWPGELVAIIGARHQALQQQLAAAVAALSPAAQQSSRGLLVWAALAWQTSVRAERSLPRPPAASIPSAAAA
ncbi:MAG TPA: squalene/phytoene synthase family protein, partial [Burkholderiales bacterium]|nr:squalene/phytoene synthase family protein [Burkholderiales bacterium]